MPSPDCTEDVRICPNGIANAAIRVCWAVCGRALPCNRTIPRESLPLRQDNLSSHRPAKKTNNTLHLTVGGSLNRQSRGHCYLCTYHVTRSDVQLYEETFQQKPIIVCNKTGTRTVFANVLYFPDGLPRNKSLPNSILTLCIKCENVCRSTLWSRGNIVASHLAVPGSIPCRVSFSG